MANEYENVSFMDHDTEQQLYGQKAELKTWQDFELQRGTPIPALFNIFYKFIQNPSTVSVETFRRMYDTDDTVGSGIDFLVTLLAARLGRYQHPSEEITDWVNKALDQVAGGFNNALKEILSGTWAGFYAGEQCWVNNNLGWVIKQMVSLPPATVLFEVNRTGELTDDGILQYQRNYNPSLLGGGGIFGTGFALSGAGGRPDPFAKFGDLPYPIRVANSFQYLAIRIPRKKVLHFSFSAQGKFGNPYGRSLLRRAYKWWILKDAITQMMSIALDRKGTPLMVVFCDPNTTVLDSDKVQDAVNQKGSSRAAVRSDVAAQKVFRQIHNDSVIFLPGKKDTVYSIEKVDVSSNAEVFISAIDRCDKGIMRSLLVPSLIFTSGDGTGSYSLGQEHAKTFEKILDGMLFGVKDVLLEQWVKRLLVFNFPRSAWEKDGLGDFSKRDFTQDEIEKILNAQEKAVNIGAINMNDLNDRNRVRETAGFDPITDEEMQAEQAEIDAQKEELEEGADDGDQKKKEESGEDSR